MRIDIFHNIRWSRYKARVFSALHSISLESNQNIHFFQIADTSGQRKELSAVDLDYHRYPHILLFPGSYESIPRLKLIATLFSKVFQSDAELVLIPGYDRVEHWGMLLAAILSKKKRAVFCDSTLYDRNQSYIKGLFKKLYFSLCNGVFCYGTRARDFLLHYGVNPKDIYYRVQAAALPKSYSIEGASSRRCELAPSAALPRFLYVGRLSSEKSVDVLIRAFSHVHISNPLAQLVLVGAGSELPTLSALAVNLNLTESVEFLGSMNQDNLAEQYSAATCLILPSHSEPWGLVVNEALHYGCPVIVSHRCGCTPELLQNQLSGLTFEAGNWEELANKMLQAIDLYSNTSRTTESCLSTVEPFTPFNSANQILSGCTKILEN